ncbi:MAG: DUF3098 domain-containing protein [Bacteroidales bacterium]|jgi:hypothetical protein|nr:DUF3098 domain-containing protein [Bacteroidales bacterium]
MAKPVKKKVGTKAGAGKQSVSWAPGMPFAKINYILLVVGIVVMAIGFILLSGGGSDDPAVFDESIFNTRRLIVAPIVLVLGILVEFAAIFFKFKPQSSEGVAQEK